MTEYEVACWRLRGHEGNHDWRMTDPIDLDAESITLCGESVTIKCAVCGRTNWRTRVAGVMSHDYSDHKFRPDWGHPS